MKLLVSFLAALGLQLMVVPAHIVFAESSRTPAEATAHALDELANLCAQRRPECPPTVTLTPTWTPSPTSTSTPLPTETPAPTPTASLTATATPCWLTDQDLGDPDSGFVVFGADGAPIPCPADDQAAAAVADTPPPTITPTVASSATPVVVYVQQPAPAPQVQERIVVETVVVTAAVVPATPSSPSTLPPRLTLASTPAPAAASPRTPTATAPGVATATVTPTPVPPAAAASTSNSSAAQQGGRWDWGGFLEAVGIAAILVVAGIWLLTRRKVVVWGARHKPERETVDA